MTTKNIRLLDKHPTMQKLHKLFAYADDLGISLVFTGFRVIVQDDARSSEEPTLYLEDIESSDSSKQMDEFPPLTDYKVIYEKIT